MSWIYLITNTVNGKLYVGQTTSTVLKRWRAHQTAAKNAKTQTLFMRAIKKYGPENFSVATLESCSDDILDQREVYWIKELATIEHGYNLTEGGRGGRRKNPVSQETKEKIAKAHKGKSFSEEHRKNLSEAKRRFFDMGGTSWNKGMYGEANCLFGIPRPEAVRAKVTESKKRTPVEQYDLAGNFIKRFDSILDACIELSVLAGKPVLWQNIIKVCQGKRKKACGYGWKYGVKNV